MRFGRGATLLAAAVMASGLAGCGGGDEPTEPSTTVSPRTPDDQSKTSDASQGETSEASGSESSGSSGVSDASESSSGSEELPDDMPAVAKERTKAGAAAFGAYYHRQLGEAIKTGDTSVVDSLSSDSCPPCEATAKKIRRDQKDGISVKRNPYKQSNVSATKRPDAGYKVAMKVHIDGYELVKDGEEVSHVEATNFTLTEHVKWSEGRWTVSDWAIS